MEAHVIVDGDGSSIECLFPEEPSGLLSPSRSELPLSQGEEEFILPPFVAGVSLFQLTNLRRNACFLGNPRAFYHLRRSELPVSQREEEFMFPPFVARVSLFQLNEPHPLSRLEVKKHVNVGVLGKSVHFKNS